MDSVSLNIFSDASGEKGFGFINPSQKKFGWGLWSKDELKTAYRVSGTSSTHLEILAITKAIVSLASKGDAVLVQCDSLPSVYTMERKYCRFSEDIQGLILSLDKYLMDMGISIIFKHLKRTDDNISVCDNLSKGIIPANLVLGTC